MSCVERRINVTSDTVGKRMVRLIFWSLAFMALGFLTGSLILSSTLHDKLLEPTLWVAGSLGAFGLVLGLVCLMAWAWDKD